MPWEVWYYMQAFDPLDWHAWPCVPRLDQMSFLYSMGRSMFG
jgi:hypothetical protein